MKRSCVVSFSCVINAYSNVPSIFSVISVVNEILSFNVAEIDCGVVR